MFLLEMKFDMALKGTASCVTPGPMKAIQTPQEQIKNASSFIWSDISFFQVQGRFFFFKLQAFDPIRLSFWQSSITTNPAVWRRPWTLLTWMAKKQKPHLGTGNQNHTLYEGCVEPCKYLGLE